MDKFAYIGVINHDENLEYPLNFSSDGIYEVVCKFNGGCEIKIKSSNYIYAHEIHKDYYKFHINVISKRKYILSIRGIFRHQCSYNIIFKKAIGLSAYSFLSLYFLSIIIFIVFPILNKV